MERLVQLRNNFIIPFLGVFALIGCKEQIEFSSVLSDDLELSKRRGVFYYQEEPFFGEIVKLFENGDTMEVANYNNGIKQGQTRKYWKSGGLKFKADYDKGLYHGKVEEWYEEGQQFTSFTYKEGHEEGQQRAWKPDGSIKANYEVVGNRKYGLTGSKNCNNDWSEDEE